MDEHTGLLRKQCHSTNLSETDKALCDYHNGGIKIFNRLINRWNQDAVDTINVVSQQGRQIRSNYGNFAIDVMREAAKRRESLDPSKSHLVEVNNAHK